MMNETSQQVLNGRYQIEALIGRGGMADVYRATDLSLERTVAVKMLRPDLARDPIFQTRFRREAQSSASLNHPNIVGVYDTGQAEVSENGGEITSPYIVMEHIEGVTLRHILHGTPGTRTATAQTEADAPPPPPGTDTEATQVHPPSDPAVDSKGDVLGVTEDDDATQAVPQVSEPLQEKIDHALGRPLTEQEAAGYMAGVLAALHYSHSRGIVHRDIKPSNVMVSNASEVKVMDFGIARALADSAQTMTQTSAVVGTAQYLSPEQARGEVVDHRSDLYSAGCVLFELLTNRPPFIGESPVSVAYQHVREDPPWVSDYNNRVTPAMESVVGKALAKDPAQRFQTADEFNHAIQQALVGVAVEDAPTTEMASVAGGGSSFDNVVAPTGVSTPLSARTPEDPDIEDYYTDYREPVRRRRGAWALVWLLLILALIAGGTFVLARMLDAGEPVSVPEVENMPRSEAISTLSDAGLEAEPEMQNHSEVAVDHAIGTDPEAGSEVDDGSTVTLFISEGSDRVTVPDGLIGETEESVRQLLEDIGLEVGEVSEEDHDSLAEGEVSGTDPGAGARVESGSAVDLTVSTGMMEVPGGVAVGEWRNNVESALEGAGIPHELEWVETGDVDFDGEVISILTGGQPISSGDRIPNDAAVLIRAGYQPEQAPVDEDNEADDDDDEPDDADDDEDDEGDEPTDDGNGNGNNEDDDDDDEDEEPEEEDDDEDEDDEPGNSGNADNQGNNGSNRNNGGGNGNGNDDED